MSATYCSNADKTKKRTLLLAMGTADGQLFVCAPMDADPEMQRVQNISVPHGQIVRRYDYTDILNHDTEMTLFVWLW